MASSFSSSHCLRALVFNSIVCACYRVADRLILLFLAFSSRSRPMLRLVAFWGTFLSTILFMPRRLGLYVMRIVCAHRIGGSTPAYTLTDSRLNRAYTWKFLGQPAYTQDTFQRKRRASFLSTLPQIFIAPGELSLSFSRSSFLYASYQPVNQPEHPQ